ncbi:membrane protein [Bacteroidia bacterium]|nr:membrane protein [Bacteroidia bacterium]
MKNILKPLGGLMAGLVLFAGCEDFLDTQDLTHKNTDNFPQTLADAQMALAAIYNNLGTALGANGGHAPNSFLMVSELAADDRLGGGGGADQRLQATDMLLQFATDEYDVFWQDRYAGINRANTAIETLGNCEGFSSDVQKNKMLGEAYFLRAFFYYELASLFERVPLHLNTLAEPLPQSDPDDIWGQIVADLKQAIELMKPAGKTPSGEAGHADAYVAEVMMARAFLFYTGFYNKTDVTLPDGSKVTKADVTAWITDCKDNSGYALVSDYRNLWAYTNPYTVEEYGYTKGKGLQWVGNQGEEANTEAMFAIKFNKFADWGNRTGCTNGYAVFTGIRGGEVGEEAFPIGGGWGAGPVATNLFNEWVTAAGNETNDVRLLASICNLRTELPAFPVGGGWNDWVQGTNYYSKKSGISGKSGGEYKMPFDKFMYDLDLQWDICYISDQVLMRYAEVLLLHSELTETADGINAVRARAGLGNVPYSLDALQKERRWELAFEGLRWNDIRRWGIAADALDKQANVAIYIGGLSQTNTPHGGGYRARYEATHGFFPIPERQIELSQGVYTQNAGWSGNSYGSW